MDKLKEAREKINIIDKKMAELFSLRMEAVGDVAEYKREHNMPIFDKERELSVIEKNSEYIKDEEMKSYYRSFISNTMRVSKDYQKRLLCQNADTNKSECRILHTIFDYDIIIERNSLSRAASIFNLNRKVLVVTDDGVPTDYVKKIADACRESVCITLPQGEQSKSFASLEKLCKTMQENSFTRADAVVAVGGGVVGDLSGFAASCYQRGIDFYNIPTTLLSQIDSSIGGKTAINLDGVKNSVGAFYQPKGVLIDPDVLSTLDRRQFASGLAEAIKMAATCDRDLFSLITNENIDENIDEIIYRSILVKKNIVEKDEKETGLRRVLNFGHTVGHAIESYNDLGALLHGECVALGMLFLCSDEVRDELIPVLENAGLPTKLDFDVSEVLSLISHDKKREGQKIHYVYVSKIGEFELKTAELSSFCDMVKGNL